MSFPPLIYGGAGRVESFGENLAASLSTNVPSNATEDTKGSWVELHSSTPFDSEYLTLVMSSATQNGWLVDLAIGGAGSEQPIVENLFMECVAKTARFCVQRMIPISVPAGSRISARSQSSGAGPDNIWIHGTLNQAAFGRSAWFSRCKTYGVITSTTLATGVDPGAVVNTWGSWVEFTASCDNPVKAISVYAGNNLNTALTTMAWNLDIGIGSAGNEERVVGEIYFGSTGSQDTGPLQPGTHIFPVDIPAGTRIALRGKCSVTTAVDRVVHFSLQCWD